MELKEKFQNLVESRDKLRLKKVEAETQLKVAKGEMENLIAELQKEYGVSSIDEADKKLSSMKDEIDKVIEECEKELAKYEVD